MRKTNLSIELENLGEKSNIFSECMTEEEVKTLLAQPDMSSTKGIYDRAIMEVLYSTGIRISELIKLKVSDIDFDLGLITINSPGKWKSQQRIVPIGNTACDYVKRYLSKIRPSFIIDNDPGYLFLSNNGKIVRQEVLGKRIRKYISHSGFKKGITPYSFRTTYAVHMFNNGADICYLKQVLGYRITYTPQVFTCLNPKELKEIHTRCHPHEKRMENLI